MKGADATIAEAGALTLREIVIADGEIGIQAVFKAGALPVLIESLATFKSNASICEAVSVVIMNVATGSETPCASYTLSSSSAFGGNDATQDSSRCL